MLDRAPGPSFDPRWYAAVNDDVVAAGLDPLIHFLEHGYWEGRTGRRQRIETEKLAVSISVVIPTHNRAEALPRVVESLRSTAASLDYEIIIVNDGSSDNTREALARLEKAHANLSAVHIENQGAGVARNHGAAVATKDIILFMGDDIIPANRHFLSAHAHYHQENSKVGFSVLGKVDWPEDPSFEVTPVMRHIQGTGGEQFGYADMAPHRAWDWRFFYTCNVSVKRNVVTDWKQEGFRDSFRGCGFEDGEFAYRMAKKHGAFNVFYVDDSLGHHYHRHTVSSFVRRQRFSGSMAQVLLEVHPELADQSGVAEIQRALNSSNGTDLNRMEQDLRLADSLVRWASALEQDGSLGSEVWHKALLHSIFKISMEMGYLERAATPTSNYAAAVGQCVESACSILERELPRDQWNSLGLNSLS
jgi:GT2 family glycosyltransferase